jgi:hypothetical protein
MAKRRKSKGRRRGGKKSKKGHSAPKHSLGVEGGAGITLFKIATDKVATGASPIDALKVPGRPIQDKLMDAANRAGKNALAWDNSKYVLAGMGLHWAKNKPIVSIVLKPADKLVKMLAGKRYGL